jgi:spermidine synthase
MSERNYQLGLLATVTLTGAAVLIIEITATRILTPFFGNSIFTFSSVISTILAALALGYYAGGRIADRRPSEALFFALIALSGFAVLLLQLLNVGLLPGIAYRLSMINGPLLVSLLLFLLPALLLGMLSPFAIKLLYQGGGSGVGNAAGLVFFWSTLGSIGGSLGAGFLLIPAFGVDRIVIGVGLGLVLLGTAGLLVFFRARRALTLSALLLGLTCSQLLNGWNPEPGYSAVYRADGLYEKIVIRDIPYQGRRARVLLQDRNINSGMYLDDGRMAFDYTRYFDLYRLFVGELKTALAIGGGAYSVPKAILRDSPAARVDVAEIEPALFELAQRYFGLPGGERIGNHVVDGRRFLHDSEARYELIFLDVYRSFAAVPMQFTTREFFTLAAEKLAPGGVLISNYFGSLGADTRPQILSILKTMRAVFPQVYLIATVDPGSDELQNFIFIGHRQDRQEQRLDLKRARDIDFSYPQLRGVAELEIEFDAETVDAALLLTDNYAPVELYAAKVLRRYDDSKRAAD